jgi:hypothetical protein
VDRLETAIEGSAKRAFQWAIDWPGWCRSGKTELEAMEHLVDASERYNLVIERAGLEPLAVTAHDLFVVETVDGKGGTDFGVPSIVTTSDGRPLSAAEADRQARLVEACWTVLDEVVAVAPPSLRKGPRGGGRDRDKVVEHVVGAEHAYAREIGLKLPAPDPADPASVAAVRAELESVLRMPSDGSPFEGRRWTSRDAARRIAWHVLDHAWEIEDRTDPA